MGPGKYPRSKAFKYSGVPPTKSGTRPRLTISATVALAALDDIAPH